MDLYKIYSRPAQLSGYNQRALLPWRAVALAKSKISLSSAQLANIAQEPQLAYTYARTIIRAPWPPGEAAIAQNAHWAYWYARNVIRGRWPEGEAAIADRSIEAFWYASNIIEGRWPTAEAAIARDAWTALHYATEIIEGPWPPGEAAMQQEPEIWTRYQSFIDKIGNSSND